MVSNPYQDLPGTAFWRSAVAEPDPLDISGLWSPKFPITAETRTVTAGSCFAQHISRALQRNGFTWLDSEPAPPLLSPESAARFNYGVFSFRTGNIYTTRLLRQWVYWAFGIEPQDTEVWEQDGRYFDPVRPQVEPDGFASPEELMRAREETYAAIRRAFTKGQLFVFTLGLTEGWRNTETGLVYSNCPGTLGGTFDPERHEFVNDSYREVRRALADVIRLAREVNRRLKFLLTVSPVPLTATASGAHVLTATSYSKSTLRAVAGDLAAAFPRVDYFPSYEIITSAPYRGRFFGANLRSVEQAGVDHVMRQFFAGLEGSVPAAPAERAERVPAPVPAAEDLDAEDLVDDVVCEDEILEFFNAN